MASARNVALWGAGGDNIGQAILNALVQDGTFDLTILARQSSKSAYPSNLKVVRVDDDLTHESLVNALKGQDIVVSAVGNAGLLDQVKIAKAMVDAGTKYFFPSEYGLDANDPKLVAMSPLFIPKSEVHTQLDILAKNNPNFSWTGLATGIWIDWSLRVKYLSIDPEAHTATYWGDGAFKTSASTLSYAGRNLLELLKRPDMFKNQRVFSQEMAVSQRDIVAELEKQQGVQYKTSSFDPDGKEQQIKDTLAKGFDQESAYDTVRAAILLEKYGSSFVAVGKQPILEDFVDVPKMTLEDVVRDYLAKQKN